MYAAATPAIDPSAMLLAIVVAANGRIDACELAKLDRLHAFVWGVTQTMVAHAVMRDHRH